MEKSKLEPGYVIELNENIFIDNCILYAKVDTYDGYDIPLGDVIDFAWFEESIIDIKDIKQVVYLGNKIYGVKQLTDLITEFNKLDVCTKENILQRYLELNKKDKEENND